MLLTLLLLIDEFSELKLLKDSTDSFSILIFSSSSSLLLLSLFIRISFFSLLSSFFISFSLMSSTFFTIIIFSLTILFSFSEFSVFFVEVSSLMTLLFFFFLFLFFLFLGFFVLFVKNPSVDSSNTIFSIFFFSAYAKNSSTILSFIWRSIGFCPSKLKKINSSKSSGSFFISISLYL